MEKQHKTQELFGWVVVTPMGHPLPDSHNKSRATVVDKKASQRTGKDVHLEPIRIRDLKMVVSCIAEF